MKSVSFDECFCSPQKRVRKTCEIIYKGFVFIS
ncbi:histidine phosphatase family protein [Clostridium thailandense]|nr:histidine phosphatase family protein [Clostridium thailandense]